MLDDADTLLETTAIDDDIATTVWVDLSFDGLTITSRITEDGRDDVINIVDIPADTIPAIIRALQTYMNTRCDPR